MNKQLMEEMFKINPREELKNCNFAEGNETFDILKENVPDTKDNMVSFRFVMLDRDLHYMARYMFVSLLTKLFEESHKDDNDISYITFTSDEAKKVGIKKNSFIKYKKQLADKGYIKDERQYGRNPNKIYLCYDNKILNVKEGE